ncbi:laminin G domain protein [Ditylenchus destructor]|nr:laminin G domain protein [Ditylenchus destructor]
MLVRKIGLKMTVFRLSAIGCYRSKSGRLPIYQWRIDQGQVFFMDRVRWYLSPSFPSSKFRIVNRSKRCMREGKIIGQLVNAGRSHELVSDVAINDNRWHSVYWEIDWHSMRLTVDRREKSIFSFFLLPIIR